MIIQLDNIDSLIYRDNNRTYIGANQNWFQEYTMRLDGCAPIAATNILTYLVHQNNVAFSKLQFPLSKKIIMALAHDIYACVHPIHCYQCKEEKQIKRLKFLNTVMTFPPSLGVPTSFYFIRGIKKINAHYHTALKYEKLKSNHYKKWLSFIKEHLNNNHPIALLNTLKKVKMTFKLLDDANPVDCDFEKHWVVITELNEADETITVLTWGGVGKINLKTLWQRDHSVLGLNTHFIAYYI